MRTIILSLVLAAAPAFAGPRGPARPPIDLNSASADELQTLPGVNADVAHRIIAARPYTAKEQLKSQHIVDPQEYARIRPLVEARRPRAIGGQGAVREHTHGPLAPKE